MNAERINASTWLLVFAKGEEAIAALTAYAAGLPSGHFHAIGAFERAMLAYWNRDTRLYEDLPVNEQVEVISLIGNVTRDEQGAPRVHAHASLGRRDGSMIGGHLKSGVVYPTLELFLVVGDVEIRRRIDAETGLSLIG